MRVFLLCLLFGLWSFSGLAERGFRPQAQLYYIILTRKVKLLSTRESWRIPPWPPFKEIKKYMGITKIIEAGKDVANLLLKINKLPEYQTIINLVDSCSRMRIELDEKDKKIKELEEKLKNKEELEIKNGVYWNKNDGDGPFCPGCFDSEKIKIRLTFQPGSNNALCPKCKNYFNFTGEKNINTRKGRYY